MELYMLRVCWTLAVLSKKLALWLFLVLHAEIARMDSVSGYQLETNTPNGRYHCQPAFELGMS